MEYSQWYNRMCICPSWYPASGRYRNTGVSSRRKRTILLTIPEFNWCSYVGDFEVFDTSSPGNENDVFKGYRGYYLTMGDVEIVIPELRPYVKEMKFIFSLLLSLLYKETTNELYRNTGTRCTIEEHIRYCKEH